MPRIVALAGPLHLDHLGAEIRQQLPRPGPRQNARQLQTLGRQRLIHASSRHARAKRRDPDRDCVFRSHDDLIQKAEMPVIARPRIRP
jgi:hypothetical protein